MCDAMTIMTIASSAMKFMGQMQQADDERATGRYNQRVKENEATETRNKGVEEENIQRQKTAELKSKQRARLGAANVNLATGTAADLQMETEVLGEVDALKIKKNYLTKAQSLDEQGNVIMLQAESKAGAAESGAIGSLLSGAGSIASSGVADSWFTPDSAAMNTLTPEEFALPFGG